MLTEPSQVIRKHKNAFVSLFTFQYLRREFDRYASNRPFFPWSSQVLTFSSYEEPQMNSQLTVLIVSRDEMLLRTRELIFGAYFRVASAGRPTEAVAQLKSTHFDLVVLCHSLRDDECELLADLAHHHARPGKTLALKPITADFAGERPWADDEIGVDAGPYGLLLKAAQMLNFRISSKAKVRHGSQRSSRQNSDLDGESVNILQGLGSREHKASV